jgi:UDP:flavonoid glycosyltransferase YjiC (YdhE family)
MRPDRSVLIVTGAGPGHLRRLVPVIEGFAASGVATHVLAESGARESALAAGATFTDIFQGRSVQDADGRSLPWPVRLVAFAARYAEELTDLVAPLRPGLVAYDTFSVIGSVLGARLRIPRVNLCAGHGITPQDQLEPLMHGAPVVISEACRDAVRTLRTRDGLADASPYCYFQHRSPDLNVYAEPPEFLLPAERASFGRLAFFGSLGRETTKPRDPGTPSPFGPEADGRFRLYVSLGTIVRRYFAPQTLRALEAISAEVRRHDDWVMLASLGAVGTDDDAARLSGGNVHVERYVDQVAVLQHASACVTHQGLNSTHEAIYHGVPMISCPFFWDQPRLAARCQSFGLALPLIEAPGDVVDGTRLASVVETLRREAETFRANLDRARVWEMAVMSGRPAVVRDMLALMRP